MKYNYEKNKGYYAEKRPFFSYCSVSSNLCQSVMECMVGGSGGSGAGTFSVASESVLFSRLFFPPSLCGSLNPLPPFSTMLGFTHSHTHCARSFSIACHLWQFWDYSVLPQPGNIDTVVWKHKYSGVET